MQSTPKRVLFLCRYKSKMINNDSKKGRDLRPTLSAIPDSRLPATDDFAGPLSACIRGAKERTNFGNYKSLTKRTDRP